MAGSGSFGEPSGSGEGMEFEWQGAVKEISEVCGVRLATGRFQIIMIGLLVCVACSKIPFTGRELSLHSEPKGFSATRLLRDAQTWTTSNEDSETLLRLALARSDWDPFPLIGHDGVPNVPGKLGGEAPNFVQAVSVISPGSQEGRILLVVGSIPGDSLPKNVDVAFLLELARDLRTSSLPYRLQLAFVDDTVPYRGSQRLLETLRSRDLLRQIRVAVYFSRMGTKGLQVARDLRSHAVFQNHFFDCADQTGHAELFPGDHFESPASGHLLLRMAGVRTAMLVTRSRSSGQQVTCCSSASAQAVGEVAGKALREIVLRLADLDAFAIRPVLDRIYPDTRGRN